MQLTVTQFLTLDGVVQSPSSPEEDPRGGFDLGGWLPPHFDEEVTGFVSAVFERAEQFLFGRRTYDEMAAYWPVQDDADGFAINRLPKHVVTSRRDGLAWAGASRLEGDLVPAVSTLKRLPGQELQVHGSATLVQSLLREGLVDVLRLVVVPVVLGWGQRLFGERNGPVGFTLRDSQVSRGGVLLLTYEPGSEVRSGDFEDVS